MNRSTRTTLSLVFAISWSIASAALGGDLVVSSDFSNSIERYDLAGNHLGSFVAPGAGGLGSPQGLTVGPDGHVYVSSRLSDNVLRYNGQTGEFMGVFAFDGMLAPFYLTFGPDQNLYVSSSGNNLVICYDGDTGEFLRIAAQDAGLILPDGISFGPDGSMYVSTFNGAGSGVKRYNPLNSVFLGNTVLPGAAGLNGALEHRFSADRTRLFVSSFGTNVVKQYNVLTGQLVNDFAGGPDLVGPVGQLMHPDGTLLVSSWVNSRILRYDATTGAFLGTFASGGGLNRPNNMAFLVPEPAGGILVLGVMLASLNRTVRRPRRPARP